MKINRIPEEDWNKILIENTQANFFQSSSWYSLLTQLTPAETNFFSVHITPELYYFIPLLSTDTKFNSKRYIGSPVGTYSGPILLKDKSYAPSDILESLKAFGDINCHFDINTSTIFKEVRNEHLTEQFTHCIDTIENYKVLRDWSKGHKSSYTNAKETFKEVSIAETKAEWQEYHALYLDASKSWKVKPKFTYTKEFFEHIYALNPEYRTLYTIKQDNKIVAGALVFYFNKQAIYWNGAFSRTELSSSPGQFLQYHILEYCQNNKIHSYDMLSSKALPNIEKFKKGFGTKKTSIFRFNYHSKINKLKHSLRSIE